MDTIYFLACYIINIISYIQIYYILFIANYTYLAEKYNLLPFVRLTSRLYLPIIYHTHPVTCQKPPLSTKSPRITCQKPPLSKLRSPASYLPNTTTKLATKTHLLLKHHTKPHLFSKHHKAPPVPQTRHKAPPVPQTPHKAPPVPPTPHNSFRCFK